MFDRPTIRLPSALFEQELLQVDELIAKYDTVEAIPEVVGTQEVDELAQGHAFRRRSSAMVKLEAGESLLKTKKFKWFRPGSGFFSSQMVETAERHGYRTVLGCVYPHDPQVRHSGVNAWHVLRGVHPGAVIVLHDCRRWTIDTLKIVLPTLVERGYLVTTISEVYGGPREVR
ncbi:hypothetical protein HK097_010953 [Rhizophlyctis rosea]|uniref:Uncharacterized protein n=1 Tax=Rhizophlyctis rosea TaxID=64517 RepID=A0AAD5X8P6_9FUNG|nr:hypothetical protein HK097_010953 [Rhizophlyctis rosea]